MDLRHSIVSRTNSVKKETKREQKTQSLHLKHPSVFDHFLNHLFKKYFSTTFSHMALLRVHYTLLHRRAKKNKKRNQRPVCPCGGAVYFFFFFNTVMERSSLFCNFPICTIHMKSFQRVQAGILSLYLRPFVHFFPHFTVFVVTKSRVHTSMTTVSLRCLGSLARCGFSVRVCHTSTLVQLLALGSSSETLVICRRKSDSCIPG